MLPAKRRAVEQPIGIRTNCRIWIVQTGRACTEVWTIAEIPRFLERSRHRVKLVLILVQQRGLPGKEEEGSILDDGAAERSAKIVVVYSRRLQKTALRVPPRKGIASAKNEFRLYSYTFP